MIISQEDMVPIVLLMVYEPYCKRYIRAARRMSSLATPQREASALTSYIDIEKSGDFSFHATF